MLVVSNNSGSKGLDGSEVVALLSAVAGLQLAESLQLKLGDHGSSR